jgi:hypothetical protein
MSAIPSDSPANAGAEPSQIAPVRILITRPDGSSREVVVSGHFREEHLSALVDEEVSQMKSGATLTVHLFTPDRKLVRSLRERWLEGLSDDRHLNIQEVLAPNGNPAELKWQLRDIQQRISAGERVHLAIRSPEIARTAAGRLRTLLLSSQKSRNGGISLWVFGDDAEQREIMEQLDGMVRVVDLSDSEREKWRHALWGPWKEAKTEGATPVEKPAHAHKSGTTSQAVDRWIKKVRRRRGED